MDIKLFLQSDLKLSAFCNYYKINKADVESYLKDNGYLVSAYYTGSKLQTIKDAIEEYKISTDSVPTIAKRHNLDAQSLIRYLKALGVYDITKKGIQTKAYNEHYFDIIDTEEKAYWLGYIYADGYIYSSPLKANKDRIDWNFELCSKGDDKVHMEKFASSIGYKKELKLSKADKYGHTRCRVCLSSKHLWETLNSYGCTPRKSLTLQFPNESIFKNNSLIRHFIRGYFDGDGCITYANKEHTIPSFQILGTKLFLEKILYYSGISCSLFHNHQDPNNLTMYINGSSRKAMNLLHYLYDDCVIYLNRKYERFKYFCQLEK